MAMAIHSHRSYWRSKTSQVKVEEMHSLYGLELVRLALLLIVAFSK
jgi:hypothetical protein